MERNNLLHPLKINRQNPVTLCMSHFARSCSISTQDSQYGDSWHAWIASTTHFPRTPRSDTDSLDTGMTSYCFYEFQMPFEIMPFQSLFWPGKGNPQGLPVPGIVLQPDRLSFLNPVSVPFGLLGAGNGTLLSSSIRYSSHSPFLVCQPGTELRPSFQYHVLLYQINPTPQMMSLFALTIRYVGIQGAASIIYFIFNQFINSELASPQNQSCQFHRLSQTLAVHAPDSRKLSSSAFSRIPYSALDPQVLKVSC